MCEFHDSVPEGHKTEGSCLPSSWTYFGIFFIAVLHTPSVLLHTGRNENLRGFFFNSMSFPNVQLLQKHPSFLTLCWSTLKVQCVEVTALTVSSIFYSILLFTLCPSCLPSLLVQLLLSSHSTSLLSLPFSPFFYLLSDFLSPYQTLKIGL